MRSGAQDQDDRLVVLRVGDLEELVLRAHLRAAELTASHKSDKEIAAWLGVSISTWRRMVAADPTLAGFAWVARRKGSKRPRRRWPPWKVELHLRQREQERRRG